MKKPTLKFKTQSDLKRWTFNQLDVQERDEAARDEDRYADVEMHSEALYETDPRYLAAAQIIFKRELARPRILAALRAKDWAALTLLTKDEELRSFAWQENFRSQGRREGEARITQPFSTGLGREVREHLVYVRNRISDLWEANGIRGEKRMRLTPDELAVEYVLGPEKEWEKQKPPQVEFTWQDRYDELERVLGSARKNKRTRTPVRKKPAHKLRKNSARRKSRS